MPAIDRTTVLSNDERSRADFNVNTVGADVRSLADRHHQLRQFAATIATTLAVFGIFMVQGILVARVLGPVGRGEFGTALFFPRDILLYVGLLGGIEIVNRYATMKTVAPNQLRRSAARLGLLSGMITAICGAVLSIVVLSLVNSGNKAYLIPYALLVCMFVPWEHMHLTVSGVDRGLQDYARYNINRLFFAATFPLLVLALFLTGAHKLVGNYLLITVCILFVASKIVGMLPTFRGIPVQLWLAKPPTDEQVPSAAQLLRDGRPYAVSLAATELFERLDILLILALASIKESGFYFVAVPAAALLTIAPNALGIFHVQCWGRKSSDIGRGGRSHDRWHRCFSSDRNLGAGHDCARFDRAFLRKRIRSGHRLHLVPVAGLCNQRISSSG